MKVLYFAHPSETTTAALATASWRRKRKRCRLREFSCSPFLDHRMVSLLFSLPEDWHLPGPWKKFVLREACACRSESVRVRVDKMGFPHPARRWFRNELREPILDVLTSQQAQRTGHLRLRSIIDDVERHRRGEVNVASGIFRVAQFEIWCAIAGA